MKKKLLSIFLLAACLPCFGAFTEAEMARFRREVTIGGVNDTKERNQQREQFLFFEVTTLQEDQDPVNYDMSRFRIHIVVVVEDKKKNKYLVDFKGSATNSEYSEYIDEYEGEDSWRLRIPFGDFDVLKIAAYVVRYGVMDEDQFIPLATAENNEEELVEWMNNATLLPFPGKLMLMHYYQINSQDTDDDQSIPRQVRQIK